MDKEDLHGLNDYWYGVGSLVAVPAGFVVLSLLIAPFWMLCRCCKCCCCKKKEPTVDVTKCSIYGPLLLVLACMIAVIAMSAIGYGANVDFSGALLYNDGEGEDGNLFDVTETLILDASSKMNTIMDITLDLKNLTESAVEEIQEILSDTSILSVGMSSLIATLDSIASIWGDYTVTTEWEGEHYEFECEFCSTFGAEIASITEEIENQTDPVLQKLDDTVTKINDSLVSKSSVIIEHMELFIDSVGSVRDDVEDIEDKVIDSR